MPKPPKAVHREGCLDECFEATNDQLEVRVKLFTGSCSVAIHGKNSGQLLLTRKSWKNADESYPLRTGEDSAKFTVLDDYEIANIRVHTTAIGKVRIVCSKAKAEDVLQQNISTQAQIMRLFGTSPSSQAVATQSQKIEDNTERMAEVYIVSSGGPLGHLAHWVGVFVFEDKQCFSCELTAIDPESGNRWSQNAYVFMRQDGLTQFCKKNDYKVLEDRNLKDLKDLKVTTSPKELERLCKTNPCNAKNYDITGSNCQQWLYVLLHNGLGIDEHLLPKPVASEPRKAAQDLAVQVVCAAGAAALRNPDRALTVCKLASKSWQAVRSKL